MWNFLGPDPSNNVIMIIPAKALFFFQVLIFSSVPPNFTKQWRNQRPNLKKSENGSPITSSAPSVNYPSFFIWAFFLRVILSSWLLWLWIWIFHMVELIYFRLTCKDIRVCISIHFLVFWKLALCCLCLLWICIVFNLTFLHRLFMAQWYYRFYRL